MNRLSMERLEALDGDVGQQPDRVTASALPQLRVH